MTEKPTTTTTDVIEKVRAVARRRQHLYTEDALARAGALLGALYAAGQQHDVSPDAWDWVGDLPGMAVDTLKPWKGDIPQTNEGAVTQLEQVVAALKPRLPEDQARDVRREYFRVRVPRLPATPWPVHDLAISLAPDAGWFVMPFTDRATVVGVTGPFGQRGAEQIAQLATELLNGKHGNPFRG